MDFIPFLCVRQHLGEGGNGGGEGGDDEMKAEEEEDMPINALSESA